MYRKHHSSTLDGDGYVYSKAIRSNDDKTMILNNTGYEELKDEILKEIDMRLD